MQTDRGSSFQVGSFDFDAWRTSISATSGQTRQRDEAAVSADRVARDLLCNFARHLEHRQHGKED